MKKARIVGFVLLLLLASAAVLYYYVNRPNVSSKIEISTNPWVGFTPFIYAQEKGWLEKTPFHFVWLVDLTDNARLYDRGFTQGFTATQYELLHFKNKNTIKPVFLIDRSYGADAIVSNRSLDELRSTKKSIKVYLERGSLNDDFFEAFVAENRVEKIPFHLIDASQKSIANLQQSDDPVVILSYQPYLSGLLKKGFQPLASTRTMERFFVIDALFADEAVFVGKEKEFIKLKELFTLSVSRLHDDPYEYYETIKGYLEGQSYEEFMATTTQIEWLHQKQPEKIIHYLEEQQVKTDRLLP
ncbi:hypothetical protein [Sulfuricurvum sp.]|uniref:hypothetical protein n=1 Tax=Sulfuricurvum sp. TaxID=2025608 RepID=UPI0026336A2F|nr:hypothetical protein [Sulfuricurvum sp.]MDD2780436.1 hypothetical protein [Sulfuricurvum sp.]